MFPDRHLEIETDKSKREQISRELGSINQQIKTYEASNQPDNPKPLTRATEDLKTHIGILYKLNPLVWNAVLDTADYSALFRYYKTSNPAGWQTFLTSLKGISIAPAVDTPTQWKRP